MTFIAQGYNIKPIYEFISFMVMIAYSLIWAIPTIKFFGGFHVTGTNSTSDSGISFVSFWVIPPIINRCNPSGYFSPFAMRVFHGFCYSLFAVFAVISLSPLSLFLFSMSCVTIFFVAFFRYLLACLCLPIFLLCYLKFIGFRIGSVIKFSTLLTVSVASIWIIAVSGKLRKLFCFPASRTSFHFNHLNKNAQTLLTRILRFQCSGVNNYEFCIA